jgi:GDP-D-mannose dehydratase
MKYPYVYGFEGQDGKLLSNFFIMNSISFIGVSKNKTVLFEDGKKNNINNKADTFVHFEPKSIFYFAAYHQSSENIDDSNSKLFLEVNFINFVDIVEKIKNINSKIPIIYASSKLIFGNSNNFTENLASMPKCHYSYTKSLSRSYIEYNNTLNGTNIYNCILFNHESKYRKKGFLLKKIHDYCISFVDSEDKQLHINNSSSYINFCRANDFVLIMNELISTDKPGDYIFCNDEPIQIKDVVKIFFKHYGIPMSKLVDREIQGNRAMNYFNAENNKLKSVVNSSQLLTKSYQTIIKELIDEINL